MARDDVMKQGIWSEDGSTGGLSLTRPPI